MTPHGHTCQRHQQISLHTQGVPLEDVAQVLRERFGTSGIAEKAARRQ